MWNSSWNTKQQNSVLCISQHRLNQDYIYSKCVKYHMMYFSGICITCMPYRSLTDALMARDAGVTQPIQSSRGRQGQAPTALVTLQVNTGRQHRAKQPAHTHTYIQTYVVDLLTIHKNMTFYGKRPSYCIVDHVWTLTVSHIFIALTQASTPLAWPLNPALRLDLDHLSRHM